MDPDNHFVLEERIRQLEDRIQELEDWKTEAAKTFFQIGMGIGELKQQIEALKNPIYNPKPPEKERDGS